MSVTIELFGIPRERAGQSRLTVASGTLGQIIVELGRRCPPLADTCFDGPRLKPEYIVSVNGDRFVRDPATPVAPGDALLLLSADAGG